MCGLLANDLRLGNSKLLQQQTSSSLQESVMFPSQYQQVIPIKKNIGADIREKLKTRIDTSSQLVSSFSIPNCKIYMFFSLNLKVRDLLYKFCFPS